MRIPLKLSLIKTATFAVIHFIVAFSVAYLLTGSAPIASALALLEPLANTVAYFFHDRLWARFAPAGVPVHSHAGHSLAPVPVTPARAR
jgi:uncharacterized membrane protein